MFNVRRSEKTAMKLYYKAQKILAAALAAVMGITCFPLTAFAQESTQTEPEYETILSEDFENKSDSDYMGPGLSIVELDGGGKVLQFHDTSESDTIKTNLTFEPQSGEIIVEYSLYVVSDENKSTFALTTGSKAESNSASSSSNGEFLRFKTTGSDSRTYEFRGGDSTKTPSAKAGSYECNKWIALKVVINTTAKTFNAYADGTLLGENIAMSCKTEGVAMNSVDNISFLTGSKDTTQVYIDNISVKVPKAAGVEPEPGPDPSGMTPADTKCIDFVAAGWKLQLPQEDPNKPGSVLEKSPTELADGYAGDYFYATKDEDGKNAIVFHCPVNGYKTGNTTYARSELREMLDPKDKTKNWTWEGTHTLVAEQCVTHVPANGKVITSQIHGIEQNGDNANPLVKVQYAYDKTKGTGKAVVYLKDTTATTSADFAYEYPDVALGEKFSTEIQVVDGTVYVTIDTDDSEARTYVHNFVAADAYWKETLYYFKLGNYIQDSTDSSSTAYADVWVYSSSLTHSEKVDKVGVTSIAMTSPTVTLSPGERTALGVTVEPVKAYDKSVTWEVTSGADCVVVDANGYLTAIKEGTATVKATSVDNPSATAICTVTVQQGTVQQTKELFTLDFGTDAGLTLDSSFNSDAVTVTTRSGEGASVALQNENGNNVVKFKDDSNAATSGISFVFAPQSDTTTISFRVRIDALGEHKAGDLTFGCMYAVAAGSENWYANTTEMFRIRNAATGQLGNFSNLTYVLTNAYTPITLNADKVVGKYGDWVDVTYIITPDNGTANANTTDVYMNGYLVGKSVANRNSISYVNRLDIHSGTGDKMEFSIDDVKVYQGSVPPEGAAAPAPASIQLINVPSTMAVQDSAKAAVVVNPDGSSDQVTYSVTSGDAIVVSSDGYITAVKAGTATLRVTSMQDEGIHAEKTITVVDKSSIVRVESIAVKQSSLTLSPGGTARIEVTVLPENATEKGVKYEFVSGSDIVGLSADGTLTGKAVGTAKIRVTSLDNASVMETVTVSCSKDLKPGTVIYQDSFDGTALNNTHWAVSLAKDNTFVTVENGAMTVVDANSAAQPKVTLAFDPTSGTFSMQFKIKVEQMVTIQGGSEVDTEYKNLRIAFGSGTITTTSNEAFCIRSDGTHFTYNVSGSTYETITGDYKVSDWNTVTFVTNVESDTTDVYINGEKLLTGAVNKVSYSVIDKMCFSADTSKYSKYIIDDLVIWAGDYDDFGKADEPNQPSGSDDNNTGSGTSTGGSSSGTNQSVTTETTSQGGTTSTQTIAAPAASSKGDTATASVSSATGKEIVRQAVTNKSENVVIAPTGTDNASRTEVSIPASTVGQIGTETNASLTVSTAVAEVTIPNSGLGDLSKSGGNVTVIAERTGNTVELSVTAGGKKVEDVPVTLTVPAEQTTAGTVAVLIHEDGTREVIRKSVADSDSVTIPLNGSAKVEIVDNSKSFSDVPANNWAADAVAFTSAHELFNGTGHEQFSPNLPMSRGMLAVVLHNLESNPSQTLTGTFGDVSDSAWYAEGVTWAAERGIVTGYGSGQFGPDDDITREQLAVMLWRYAGKPAATGQELNFNDAAEASDYALEALCWAAEKGILNGYGDGRLNPGGMATRAQVAQMLKNYMESN